MDYREFLHTYPHLNSSEKSNYLHKALFEDPEIFLASIADFLNVYVGIKNPVKSEKFPFACFLKTINDLCCNTPILLNLKGEIKDAWELYFKNKTQNSRAIRAVLKGLIYAAGFAKHDELPVEHTSNPEFSLQFSERVKTFIDKVGTNSQEAIFLQHEQNICTLYMLGQFETHALNFFIQSCKELLSEKIVFNELYFLYDTDLSLLEFCTHHVEELHILFQTNIPFAALCILAQSRTVLFQHMLEHATLITPLMQDQWLSIGSLLAFSKQDNSLCEVYLDNPKSLAKLKAAHIPFSMLILGNAATNCYNPKEIISVIALREKFPHLLAHPKVDMQVFSSDLGKLELSDQNYFMLACLKSETFRIFIKNPEKVHSLLDMGFAFVALYEQANAHPNLIQALMDDPKSVQSLLKHPAITHQALLTSGLSAGTLRRIEDIFQLLSHGISFQTLVHWPNLMVSDVLDHRLVLIRLQQQGIDLNQLFLLDETYPKHALLILTDPNNPHAQWWIKRQNKLGETKAEPNILLNIRGKYHVVFDLDDSTASYTTDGANSTWIRIFKEKELCVEVPTYNPDIQKTSWLHIIHPGFIELLRFLRIQGIQISFFSRGPAVRNIPLVKGIFIKAFGNQAYELSIRSREDMGQEQYKNLTLLLKSGEDLKQMVLIDDNAEFCHPAQQANFIGVSEARDHTFKDIMSRTYRKKDSNVRAANQSFYVAGLLNKAIQMAELHNITLSEALSQLKDKQDSVHGNEHYYKLNAYQTYYEEGLALLQKTINPTLELATQEKFFADGYTLNLNSAKHRHEGDEMEANKTYTKRIKCKN